MRAYVANQINNGLTIGFIYALMAVGLTLIYSVQGIVSFAHGQFYMLGGYVSYYFLQLFTDLNPIVGVPVAGLATMLAGLVFDRLFLRPMQLGRIERAGEYAILVTFAFGFFLEYTVLAVVGPFSQKTPPFHGSWQPESGPVLVDSQPAGGRGHRRSAHRGAALFSQPYLAGQGATGSQHG